MESKDKDAVNQSTEFRPSWWFWVATVICVVGVGGISLLKYRQAERAKHRRAVAVKDAGLLVLGEVPDFSLVERSGKVVSRGDLRGEVWLANFVFTSCAGPCPIMSERMREVRAAVAAAGMSGVRFVSISVDPDRDTPSVLTTYAEQYGADSDDWLFFTGDKQAIFDLTLRGFKLAVEDEIGTDQIIHSTKFVLVDRRGRIRGYYDAITPEEMEDLLGAAGTPMPTDVRRQLLADMRTLLREGGR